MYVQHIRGHSLLKFIDANRWKENPPVARQSILRFTTGTLAWVEVQGEQKENHPIFGVPETKDTQTLQLASEPSKSWRLTTWRTVDSPNKSLNFFVCFPPQEADPGTRAKSPQKTEHSTICQPLDVFTRKLRRLRLQKNSNKIQKKTEIPSKARKQSSAPKSGAGISRWGSRPRHAGFAAATAAPGRPNFLASPTRASATSMGLRPTNDQGSLHYTPEHCLVNGEEPCFKWARCII